MELERILGVSDLYTDIMRTNAKDDLKDEQGPVLRWTNLRDISPGLHRIYRSTYERHLEAVGIGGASGLGSSRSSRDNWLDRMDHAHDSSSSAARSRDRLNDDEFSQRLFFFED